MKKVIILLLICIFSYTTKGQDFCITPSPNHQPLSNFGNDLLNNDPIFSAVFQSPNSNTAFTFKIYIHVIRKSDGTGGQSVSDVNEAVAFLHNDFAPHNIYFAWNKTIDYIDSDTFYNPTSNNPTSQSYVLKIFNLNPHQDGIDIYLFDDDSGLNAGRANFWGSNRSSQLFVSGKSTNSYTKSHIVSHEMGHLLQLYHTHETYFAQKYISGSWMIVAAELELVDGSNAARRGDLVVDTPADPGLRTQDPITKVRTTHVDLNTCLWTKPIREAVTNSLYTPDTKNIMAYTQPECMEYFTLQQGKRMR